MKKVIFLAIVASLVLTQTASAQVGGNAYYNTIGNYGYMGQPVRANGVIMTDQQRIGNNIGQTIINNIKATVKKYRTIDIACAKAAVTKRENSIAAALNNYASTTAQIFATRQNSLLAAWSQEKVQNRTRGIVAARTAANRAELIAKRNYVNATNAATKLALQEMKACGANDDGTGPGVATTTPPTTNDSTISVNITSPTTGASSTQGTALTLSANVASATLGGLSTAKVEFFRTLSNAMSSYPNEPIGEVNTAPYTFVWNNPVVGDYFIFARATAGTAVATSSSVQYIVRTTAVSTSTGTTTN